MAETLDWAQALVRLRVRHLDADVTAATLGCLLKDRDDLAALSGDGLTAPVSEATEGSPQ